MLDLHPENALRKCLRLENDTLYWENEIVHLSEYERIWIFGVGKAAKGLASALYQLLGDRIYKGVVITPDVKPERIGPIQILPGNHPVPLEESLASAQKLLKMAEEQQSGDLTLFLITGGASALFCYPAEGISFEDKQQLSSALLRSGASIHEMNTVRKHLSRVKGGQMLRRLKSKTVINFIISDVPGDDPSTIGSGPTIPDPTTLDDVQRIMRTYLPDYPVPLNLPETPKPGEPGLPEIFNCWVNTPSKAALSFTQEALRLGLAQQVYLATSDYSGKVEVIAKEMFNDVNDLLETGSLESRWFHCFGEKASGVYPKMIIYFGESEVNVTGSGRGGRNQHLALLLAREFGKLPELGCNLSLLSVGTDGIDGNTDAAGAILNHKEIEKLNAPERLLTRHIENFDSNTLLSDINALLKSGPTGNNLMDLQIILLEN